jgi:hypothetical protein
MLAATSGAQHAIENIASVSTLQFTSRCNEAAA